MKALLLAGGTGTRLQPLTKFIPKCLAPIRGRPLLDYWIAALVESGINEILINTHYLSHLVEFYVKNSSWKNNVTLINEATLLGTGGTISENHPIILASKEAYWFCVLFKGLFVKGFLSI